MMDGSLRSWRGFFRGVRLSSFPSRSKRQNSRAKIPPATQARWMVSGLGKGDEGGKTDVTRSAWKRA